MKKQEEQKRSLTRVLFGYKDQAKQLLRDAYFSVVGSDKFCIIEEK